MGGRAPDGCAGGGGQLDGLTTADDIGHRFSINFVARVTRKPAGNRAAQRRG
jgi:hypothetical protein